MVAPRSATAAPSETRARPAALRFDYLVTALSTVLVVGLYSDGWAHEHGQVDSFFSPWHGIMYTGFLLGGLAPLLATLTRMWQRSDEGENNWRDLRAWWSAVPAGYRLSLLGIPLFVGGGIFDLLWHTLFGIEVDTEALLSPSHLLLALAGVLLVTGPLRAAWQRTATYTSEGWRTLLPALLSLTYLFALFAFFTAYVQPFHYPLATLRGTDDFVVGLGVAAVLLHAALLMGIVLLASWRWRLPAGSLTLLFTLPIAFESVLHDQYRLIPVGLAGGIAADLLLRTLRPWERSTATTTATTARLRAFAFLMPVVLFVAYFLDLALTGGITWSIHLWLGATVLAGVVGLLVSYLIVPPATVLVVRRMGSSPASGS